MSHFTLDRVKETTAAGGTGPFTFTGAIPGFSPFVTASKMTTDGDTTWYCAVYSNEWEIGLGTRTSSTTMSRTVISNHLGTTALINFSAAPIVFGTVPAARLSSVGPSVSAYRSTSNQTLSSGVFTKVQLNGVSFDTGNCFDSTTNFRFQPNVEGYYLCSGSIYYSGTGMTSVSGAIYKNGIMEVQAPWTTPGASTGGVVSVTRLIYMNGTTDYLELWAQGVGTTVAVVYGPPNTSFTANLSALPGQAMLAPVVAPGPAFSAYLSGSNQPLSNGVRTVVNFNGELFDTANCFDSTTNRRFQPNVAGYYNVQWQVQLGCTGSFGIGTQSVNLFKNGAEYAWGNYVGNAAPTTTGMGGSCLVYMNGTTDYLDVRTISTPSSGVVSITAGQTATYFSASLAALPQVPATIGKSILTAYLTAATNSSDSTATKVPIETVTANIGGMWNSANKRVIPANAGYYEVTGRVRVASVTSAMALYIAVNGAVYQGIGPEGSINAVGGSALIYCNGTTDYIELFVFTSQARAITTGVDTMLQVVGPI